MSVSAIIPFYNEEKTILSVASVLVNHPKITEVICVNDGSTDNSLKTLKSLGKTVKIINLKENHGKGYALSTGLENATGTIVIFLDADFFNVKASHIDKLIEPLTNPKIKVVLGYCTTKSYLKVFLPLTGIRAYFRKDLTPHLASMKQKGYGVETYLNNSFSKKETKIVLLKNLKYLYKYEKHGVMNALKSETKTHVQVLKEIGRRETEFYKQFLLASVFFAAISIGATFLIKNTYVVHASSETKQHPKVKSNLKSIQAFSQKIAPYINHSKFNYYQ